MMVVDTDHGLAMRGDRAPTAGPAQDQPPLLDGVVDLEVGQDPPHDLERERLGPARLRSHCARFEPRTSARSCVTLAL
jgi:hypothetical protein